jgi:hypothetical protein
MIPNITAKRTAMTITVSGKAAPALAKRAAAH